MGREHAFTRIEGVIVVVILGVVAWIAIPGFLGHRHGCGFEAGAVGCLRELKIVNERYKERFGTYADTLTSLSAAGYIDSVLGSGYKSGHDFVYSSSADGWSCQANPYALGVASDRCLFIDTTGILRFHRERPASSVDTVLDEPRYNGG